MNKLIKKLAIKMSDWCVKNGRRHLITGGPNGETVYLVRDIFFKSKYGCIYIHRFMRSDSDDPHDHPWNFFTYVISGGYTEVYYDIEQPVIGPTSRTSEELNPEYEFKSFWTPRENKRVAGSLAYRKATDIHQVVVDKPRTMDKIKDAPFTICLMGPRLRHWGFWKLNNLGSVWTDWRQYLSISPNDARAEGSE